MKEYIFVSTIEGNYSLWISVYEGEKKEKGTFNNFKLPHYFESSSCIFRGQCNAKITDKVEELINYSHFANRNLSIIYDKKEIIHDGMIVSEEQVKSIIKIYNNVSKEDSCDGIIKMIEQLSQYEDNIEKFTNKFLNINYRIFTVNLFCLSTGEQEKCSAALLEKYEQFKNKKLQEAKEKDQRICIYFEMGTVVYGEEGYKYKKEYIYPDGHTEKETGHTN